MIRECIIAALISLPAVAAAQGKMIKSVSLNGKVQFAGVDRPGDLYVVMEDGYVRKYDGNGKEIASKKYTTPPTLFDPRDGTLSFAYFRTGQRLEYLSPDMSSSDEKTLSPEFAISAWLACPSKNELWILDSEDLSLKKTVDRGGAIGNDVRWTLHRPESVSSITYMREYQNFLFILDQKKGIDMFNGIGKLIREVNEPGLPWFNFLGEELYYPKGQTLQFLDLYTAETREMAIAKPFRFVMLTDLRMMVVGEKSIEFFEFTPN
jgi:hypothetical protein